MSDAYFNPLTAPMRIGKVHLRARDAEAVAGFYHRILGLSILSKTAARITLGVGEAPLLVVLSDPSATPRNLRAAGLFHTAFLLPSRADLAHWLAHALAAGVALQGASDHIVSEAIYLSDPEGNGIEVYADRPLAAWRNADGHIHMATEPLDAQDLLAAGTGAWAGFPTGGSIGHVHLQVGDTGAAEGFYRDILGFDIASRYPGASFLGSGGYHHHFATNIWNSNRAGPRPDGAAGLERVEIVLTDAPTRMALLERAQSAGLTPQTQGDTLILSDPWGTQIALAP